jgi:DNA helicase-2/ATP-dependent DNA helicase PcrA
MGIPKRGLGDGSIAKISDYAAQEGLGFYDGALKGLREEVFTKRISTSLENFLNLFEEAKIDLKESEPYLLSVELLEKAGYLPMLRNSKFIEDKGRLENVEELLSDIASFYERGEGGLEDYLLNIALLTDMDDEHSENPVMLMSLHSAKGLEFSHVYLVGMDEDLFPSFLSKDSDEEMEEERRLCYVAITRAMKKLVLTRADTRFRFGQPQWMMASRFIGEIPQELLYTEGKTKGNSFQRTIPFGADKKGEASDFRAGDKVFHKVFGKGIVVGIQKDNKKIQVAFETAGFKELHLDYAPLRKEA